MIYINCMRIVQWMLGWVALGALVACGGGGGGSSGNNQTVVPAGTISLVASSNDLANPKRMTYNPTSGNFYVTAWNPDNTVNDWILEITPAGAVNRLSTIDSPVGIALSPSNPNQIYVTAKFPDGSSGVGLYSDNTVEYALNYSGLAFGSNFAIAADFDEVQLLTTGTPWGLSKTVSPLVAGGAVAGVAKSSNNWVYYSVPSANAIYRFDVTDANPVPVALNLGGYALYQPYSLAVDDSGRLLVINQTNAAGDGEGALIVVADPAGTPSVTELVPARSGICGATAMTYSAGYAYVVNGTCTNGAHPKAKSILKIKT